MYRIDWPDAAFNGGVGKRVNLIVVCSGVDTTFFEVTLSPAVNVTHRAGVAVAPADGNGNDPAVLYTTQGAVTFGQVKILANAANEGALHIVNSNDDGFGQFNSGGNTGQKNIGSFANGQLNIGFEVGQYNQGAGVGQINEGGTGNISGVDSQGIRDAMKLAPTAGDPAAGSVDKHLDDILEDTGTTLPAIMASCASVAANSTDATASGAITRKRGNSWSIALTLGEVTGYTSLWFSIKRSYDDADSASVLQVKLNSPSAADGLLYVNGAAATDATKASITVSNAGTGAIVIAVDETITDDIAPGSYYYDAQALITGAVTTPDSGTFTVTADVTRSVA
jgi:hypothetical protein